MALPVHRIPKNVFVAIGRGGGGSSAVGILANGQYSKHVLLLRGVLEAAVTSGHRQAASAQDSYDLLADIQRFNPAAARKVISYPSVGAWASRTLRALRGGSSMPGAEPAGMSGIAAATAIHAGYSAEIKVPAVDGLVVLPSVGAGTLGNGLVVVQNTVDGTHISSRESSISVPREPNDVTTGWLPLRRVHVGELQVLIDDVDPFRMPAEPTLAHRLPEATFDEWERVLRDAWTLLAQFHREVALEVAAAIRVIVPLVRPVAGQASSSSRETYGAVALSQPPDTRTLAVTLVHEVQHLKLSALLDIVTLLLPDDGRRFYAPWRNDPRPASGLLQGAYAYVGVSKFWRRQRELDDGLAGLKAQTEFARWRSAAMQVVNTLHSSGLLTPAGAEFTENMAESLRVWLSEPIPHDARVLAADKAEKHLARWHTVNGTVLGLPG